MPEARVISKLELPAFDPSKFRIVINKVFFIILTKGAAERQNRNRLQDVALANAVFAD